MLLPRLSLGIIETLQYVRIVFVSNTEDAGGLVAFERNVMSLSQSQLDLRKKVYDLASVDFDRPWKERFRDLEAYLAEKGIEKPGAMMSDENWQKLYDILQQSQS